MIAVTRECHFWSGVRVQKQEHGGELGDQHSSKEVEGMYLPSCGSKDSKDLIWQRGLGGYVEVLRSNRKQNALPYPVIK
jgi:hypothetical protein